MSDIKQKGMEYLFIIIMSTHRYRKMKYKILINLAFSIF